MLTQDSPRRRLRGIAAAAVMAATMLMPAGAVMATDANLAEVEGVAPSVDELNALVDDLNLANDVLLAQTDELQLTIAQLERERDQLQASLSRFDDLYDPLEADRQLLFELRKDLPETRSEAEAQLTRIRDLALSSDPQRLGQLVDRVDEAAPAFLDWRFGEFDSTAEFSAAYVDSGANAFDSSFEELQSEALMSVANRLDSLLTILDRVR